MAIEHTNISLGEATAALSAGVAQTAWRDALLGHASGAWTLDDEFDSSGGTIHWIVIKNTDADVDFFVCIGRRVADGVMGCCVGEDYDHAGRVLSKFAPRSDNPGYILGNDYYGGASNSVIATFTLAAALPTETSGQPLFTYITASATERLFTCVSNDYAVLNVNGVSMYIGAMVDLIVPKTGLVATPAIACADLTHGSAGRFCSVTRHPIAAADAPMMIPFPHTFLPINGNQYVDMISLQNQALLTGIYGFPDRFQGDRVAASELTGVNAAATEQGYSNPLTRPDKVGAIRAKFKGIRMTTGPIAAVAYDDLVVDGNKHVIVYAFSSLVALSPYQAYLSPYNYNTIVKPFLTMDTGIAA